MAYIARRTYYLPNGKRGVYEYVFFGDEVYDRKAVFDRRCSKNVPEKVLLMATHYHDTWREWDNVPEGEGE